MAWIRKTTRISRSLSVLLVLVWALGVPPAAEATITYVHDRLGRLVGVIDPAQGTAVYKYDAVGNILSIQRYAASAVLIIDFTPGSGPGNTVVTLTGTGFSATPSENIVTFNGVTATVTSSTVTSIVTKVPAGATTGPISVTTPTGSATTDTNFVVGAASGAPTITGFNPAIAAPGLSMTVTGTNFDPAPANDKVLFNGVTYGRVASATSTNMTVVVGQYPVGSGRLKVTTVTGTATSAADFFVPPSPYVVSDVQVTGRMGTTAGGGNSTKTITISTQQKIGLVLFEGTAGQGLQLELSGMTTLVQANVSILSPNGSTLVSPVQIVRPGGFIKVSRLPATGTYTVVVAAVAPYTGSVTLSAGAPDLVITAVTAPTTPVSVQGDGTYSFLVTWSGKNQGTVSAQANWTDRVYVSTDTTLDSSDTNLGGTDQLQALAVNATYNAQRLVTIPPVSPGTYYILVEADSPSPGNVPEINETNNVTASSAVTLLGLPDLTVTALTIPTAPIGANRDGTYTLPISYTVANQGQSTPQPGWLDGVYLSTDTTWDGGDVNLWTQQQNLNVPSGTGYTNNVTGVAPVGQAPGNYYVIAVADSANLRVETNENNNTLASTTRVTLLPLPDLAPTTLTVPTSPVSRNPDGTYDIPVSFTVANQGGGPAQAYWWDSIYVSTDAVLDGSDVDILDTAWVTAVAQGASYGQSATIHTPVLAAGTYYIILKTDNFNYVVEANENNNVLVSATPVTLAR